MKLDLHCLGIIDAYFKGKISRAEADEKIQEHGDSIRWEIFTNGFTASYTPAITAPSA